MARQVRKAIFPVAGLGTRFLPATKAMAKEMLPIVDKPLIQYAVEEAAAAGIELFIFVTSSGKSVIEDHFDRLAELESTLRERGKTHELAAISGFMPGSGCIASVRQHAPLGLGHAVWCARNLIGDEPFAVILPDDVIQADVPCMAQMIAAHKRAGGNIVATMEVPRAATEHYGVIDPAGPSVEGLVPVAGLVEKPKP